MKEPRTIVIGHKNPDTDSCASALAYAELKIKLGHANVTAACAGYPSARTEYLFDRFKTSLPTIIEDVSPRVSDIMNTSPIVVYKGQTLLEAMEYLKESQMSRLPVTDASGNFSGMISLFDLAGRMFQKARKDGFEGEGEGVVGRSVMTSISLAAKTLDARISTLCCDEAEIREINVFVGAMSIKRLQEDILNLDTSKVAIVVGDRTNLQKEIVDNGVHLMIVTGSTPIDLELIRLAKENGTSILQTPFDSATTVRRLKFSQPVELMTQSEVTKLSNKDKLSHIRRRIMSNLAENYPVCDTGNRLLGTVTKADLDCDPPVQLVLMDHNELDQAVKGATEVPIIEIMDHHRIGMLSTDKPIVVTNDVVGSTSTLVTEQYRKFGIDPTPEIAGILMGGVATDTLLLRSPTSTERDRIALDYLESISGVSPKQLLEEIFNTGSLIARETARDVVHCDKKNYKTDTFAFSVSQIEESGFENFEKKKEELAEELEKIITSEDVKFAALLVTDVVLEDSILIVAGSQKIINSLNYTKIEKNRYSLPGILSRKKQLLPSLLKAFETI